jgi:subtilisin family serine protease
MKSNLQNWQALIMFSEQIQQRPIGFFNILSGSMLVLLFSLAFDASADFGPLPLVSEVAPSCAAPGEKVSIAGIGLGAKNVSITVAGTSAVILQATGHSAEFTVPSVPTGITKVTATNPGGQSGAIDFQVKGSEICGNNFDDNCDGEVDEIDECPIIALAIDAPNKYNLKEGETKNISYTVNLQTPDLKTVAFTQMIEPQNGGLSLTSDAPTSWQSDSDIAWVVNGTLSGNAPGIYKIKTIATIQGTSVTATAETLVEVTPADLISQVYVSPPSADPDGVAISTLAKVDFSVQVNSGIGAPDSVILEQIDEQGVLVASYGALLDNGLNGDLVADDGIYSNAVNLPPFPEGNVHFRAVAHFGSDSVASEAGILSVTRFPLTLSPSDPATLITSDDPNQRVFSDHIVVRFKTGTQPNVIEATVANVGGSIIGSIPSLNIFQIGFASPKSLDELKLLVSAYQGQPEVEYAELSYETTVDAVYPNDPSIGSQKNMQVARIDEVWLLSASGGAVAIVDTGVDYNHDDLTVSKGKDFVNNDNDPMDTNGHGTHVAGIAAAIVNNGKSVAGVTNSTIWAVRGIGGSNEVLANAIKYAAGKAAVVNISGGSYGASATYEAVTKDLAGKVIVAAAGNCGSTKTCPAPGAEIKFYPCFNSNVFCVGNSTDSDSRATTSNYGSWVDIAAPGEGVLSTKLGGGTTTMSGTSMASPLVAGAARLIWNQHPSWNATKVKQRLLDTANAASGLSGKKIGNRADVFEAFFNGDFEIGEEEWSVTGTCTAKTDLGPIKPQKGEKMMFCSTGPAGDQVAATLNKTLNFVADSDFTIKFDYNFVSEEYPEFVGSIFDDSLTIKLIAPDGSETILAQESVNASSFTPVSGIDFPGGDDTVGQTGWKSISKTIPVKKGAGSYKIVIEDAGDDVYDTVLLLDNIRLK